MVVGAITARAVGMGSSDQKGRRQQAKEQDFSHRHSSRQG